MKKEPICYNVIVALGSFLSIGKEFKMGKNLKAYFNGFFGGIHKSSVIVPQNCFDSHFYQIPFVMLSMEGMSAAQLRLPQRISVQLEHLRASFVPS